MAVDIYLWRQVFPAIPSWPCPTCNGKGQLTLKQETFHNVETGPSARSQSHDAWDPSWIESRFVCLLQCNNGKCGEIATLSGKSDIEEDYYYDDNGDVSQEYSDRFWPNHIFPAPHIFSIPSACPADVRAAVVAGFSLFWTDRDSCANKWRIAIECLLTHAGIPRYHKAIKGKPRRPVSLHARIQLFRKKNVDAAECLEAVKWLGNYGSHTGGGLNGNDILQAAELLEHALAEIYKPKKSPVSAAKKINKKKGPLKKA